MAKLTKEEQEQLAALREKEEAPDEPESTRGRQDVHNYTVDFSDEAAVERAVKHGILTPAQAEEIKDDLDKDDPEPDDAPTRKLDRRYS